MPYIQRLTISTSLSLLLCRSGHAFDSGSTGVNSSFSPRANVTVTVPQSGILNYTTFTIASGVTVKYSRNVANTPVVILVQGDAIVDGSIDITGANGAEVALGPPDGYDGGIPAAGG